MQLLSKSFRDEAQALAELVERICAEPSVPKGRAHAFDGTEVHGAVDHELRGFENEVATANIKGAIKAQYRNVTPLDAVIEIIGKLLNDGSFMSERSRDKGLRPERTLVPALRGACFAAEQVPSSGAADADLSVEILGRDLATMVARAVVEILETAPPGKIASPSSNN